jgi:hypothetical protein
MKKSTILLTVLKKEVMAIMDASLTQKERRASKSEHGRIGGGQ